MNGAFYIGATGLRAQERALGVTANNITNMNTPGFKRGQIRFGELMSPSSSPDGLQAGRLGGASGVAALETLSAFDQGELRPTGSAMDLAIEGRGFVEVLGPEGQGLLWRGGTLTINPDGLLATTDGMPLRALVAVPENAADLRISPDGVVTARLGGDQNATELGRLDLAAVANPESLEVLGSGLYRSPASAHISALVPGEEGAGLFVQGAVEASNVSLSVEMVQMMLMQRAYAASAQVLQAGDQLMGIANGLRR